MIWNADKIRAELKRGVRSLVIYRHGEYRDLYPSMAAQFDGDYTVQESPGEVIVYDNYKRRKIE